MASGSVHEVANNRRHLAAWVILVTIVVGVIVLGLLDNKSKQSRT